MTGTLINIATILIGGTLGLIFGARVPDRTQSHRHFRHGTLHRRDWYPDVPQDG